MSAGALKRRSLFHGQRKRQKKTATGRTMAENLIRKQLKLTFLVIQTKRGKNSTRRSRERRRCRRRQGERRGSSVLQWLWWRRVALALAMQMKSFCSAQVKCVVAASLCQLCTSCRTTFWAQVDEEWVQRFVLLMKATLATRTRANRERNDVQSWWWWSWSRSPSPYFCSS